MLFHKAWHGMALCKALCKAWHCARHGIGQGMALCNAWHWARHGIAQAATVCQNAGANIEPEEDSPPTATVNKLRSDPPWWKHPTVRQHKKHTPPSRTCFNCGGSWPHPEESITAPPEELCRMILGSKLHHATCYFPNCIVMLPLCTKHNMESKNNNMKPRKHNMKTRNHNMEPTKHNMKHDIIRTERIIVISAFHHLGL